MQFKDNSDQKKVFGSTVPPRMFSLGRCPKTRLHSHSGIKTFSLPDHYIPKNLDSFVKLRTCLTNFKSFDTCAIICKIRDFRVKQLKKGVGLYGQNNAG